MESSGLVSRTLVNQCIIIISPLSPRSFRSNTDLRARVGAGTGGIRNGQVNGIRHGKTIDPKGVSVFNK